MRSYSDYANYGIDPNDHYATLAEEFDRRYPPPMADPIPTPYVDTEAHLPDSHELADLYERRALQMEHDAADARSPAQQEGLRLGAGTMRRKAREIRERLNDV